MQAVPEAARKDVAQLKHQGAVTERAFDKPYEAEPVSYPLGESGLLLTQLRCKKHESGRLVMMLSGPGGKGLTLNMDSKLQHHFYEIIWDPDTIYLLETTLVGHAFQAPQVCAMPTSSHFQNQFTTRESPCQQNRIHCRKGPTGGKANPFCSSLLAN